MKKGIVSFDIDMTLLDHKDYRIPESTLRAVSMLHNDYYIAVATGRDMDDAGSAGIVDDIHPDAVINQNGAKITVDGRIIYEHFMDPATVAALMEYAKGRPFAVGARIDGDDYYMNPQYATIHDMVRWNSSVRSFQDPSGLRDKKVRSMVFIGPPAWAKRIEEEFPTLRLPLFAARLGADIIEDTVSKATGLEQLCSYYGIDMKDTIVFGDSMNDYEVFKAAGLSVAMGNAFEDLKKAADYVTAPIGEDGVWKACVALGLIDDRQEE